jgi:alpha-glucosidase (family GH31 glycosyl hydrolase)
VTAQVADLDRWTYVGHCRSWAPDGPYEVAFDSETAQVRVKACAPNVLRVWCDPRGLFRRKYPSFAVECEDLSPVPLRLADCGDYVELHTGTLVVRAEKAPFRISFWNKNGELLTAQAPDKALGWSSAGEMGAWHIMAPDEAFWGLGEKREDFNKRGQRIYHWGTDLYQPDAFSPPEGEGRWYGAMPHFISSRGYSILFDNTSRTCFDFGKTDPTCYFFGSLLPAPGGELVYYLIYGPFPKAILKTFTDMVGKPFLPPLYALGNSQSWWGDAWYQEHIEDCARTYRQKRIPCDLMWACLEWYQGAFDPAEWNYETFPDPRGLVDRLHADGFRFAVYDQPCLPIHSPSAQVAREKGYFVTDAAGGVSCVDWPWGGQCGLIDFFNPEARVWWGSLHDHLAELGVDVFWLDMNEPAVSSSDWVFHNESGGEKGTLAELHNVYALLHNRAMFDWYRRAYPGRRPFLLSRSFFPGSHRYAAVWSGDTHSSFEHLRSQPRMGLSMGLSGFLMWGHDIGGYAFSDPDEELFIRWIEFAALCPLHRFHHTWAFPSPLTVDDHGAGPNFPWRYGAEDVARTYITLRQRLLPYLYSCVADAAVGTGLEAGEGSGGSGIPVMRAMVLEYPEDTATYGLDEQFMCGPSLLVAPVLERGASTKQVYLPSGTWYDYYSDAQYVGPATIECDAPLDRLPLFAAGGAIIPMAPAMQHVGERPVDPLTVEIYPPVRGERSVFVLYEDDGETELYRTGGFCTTRFECAVSSALGQQMISLRIGARAHGVSGYQPPPRDYWLRFHACGCSGLRVSLDGTQLPRLETLDGASGRSPGWCLEPDTGVCTVVVADSGKETTVEVVHAC